ncbi:MAG: hypothetical protein QXE80_08000 [Pyrobaculum sp.]
MWHPTYSRKQEARPRNRSTASLRAALREGAWTARRQTPWALPPA